MPTRWMGMDNSFFVSVLAVVIWKGEVLLVHRKRGAGIVFSDSWIFPGGEIRFGEHPQEALRKILRHDLNLDADIVNLIVHGRVPPARKVGGPAGARNLYTPLYVYAVPRQEAAVKSMKINPRCKLDHFEWVLPTKLYDYLDPRVQRDWLPEEMKDVIEDLIEGERPPKKHE